MGKVQSSCSWTRSSNSSVEQVICRQSGWKQETHGWRLLRRDLPRQGKFAHTYFILYFVLKKLNMTFWGLRNWKSFFSCSLMLMFNDGVWPCAIHWLHTKDFSGEGNLHFANLYHDKQKLSKHRQPTLRVSGVHFIKPGQCLVESWALVKYKEFGFLVPSWSGSMFWHLNLIVFQYQRTVNVG